MGWMHPVIMLATMCGGLYVLFLGFRRFQSLHLGKRVSFNWKRHVQAGTVVLALWAAGPVLGLFGAQITWGGTFIAGLHTWIGIAMLPLALIGYFTGRTLDKIRRRRKWLPVVHGITNSLLALLSLVQLYTGSRLLALISAS